jgi:GAF domain-containing protein
MFSESIKKSSETEPSDTLHTALGANEVAGIRKLFGFSEKLIQIRDVDLLLATMLDDVIELTHARNGVLLLLESFLDRGGERSNVRETSSLEGRGSTTTPRWVVRAARNVERTTVADAEGRVSDSIVQEVLQSGRPLIVSDAVSDSTFGKSKSVLSMQLSSVMCAPLSAQGEVIGALYVGNDKVKELFKRPQLDVLTIFASQASLILQNAMLLAALREDKEKLESELRDKRFGEIIGTCASMREVARLALSRS